MRKSNYFLQTKKETPSDATLISHKLMIRTSMIKQTTSGIYAWLPLGLKVLKKIERNIRLSQALTTFGVGAIINTQDESFINQDISWWVGNKIDLNLTRLENKLNVSHFKQLKPTTEINYNNRNIGFLPLFRFPRWLFCKKCRKMEYITNDKAKELDGDVPTCNTPRCKDRRLTPMRFITICEKGHTQDFPWFDWAHSKSNVEAHGRCDRYKARLMYHYNPKRGASYQALSVLVFFMMWAIAQTLFSRGYLARQVED